MSIKDLGLKIKSFVQNQRISSAITNDILIALIIVLVGTASFGLGKLSAFEKQKVPISVLQTRDAMYATVVGPVIDSSDTLDNSTNITVVQNAEKGIVLASKSGTKYYYPNCSGVSRIKEENKVWYSTIKEAEDAGLTLAANCSASQ